MSELITQLFATMQEAIVGFITAFKDGFLELIYVDPSAASPEVSPLALFFFIMIGLGLGITVVGTIISLVRRRR